MSLEITSLREEHLEAAANLVCTRFKALRQHVPLLPPKYEEAGVILSRLHDLIQEFPGVAAIRGGRLVGCLAGLILPLFLGKRSAYSPEWANGAELGESRRIYDAMYARLSEQWVADGCLTHVVTLLANDRQGVEGWQWLGFGLANVDGVRGLGPLEAAAAQLDLRQAKRQEAAVAAFFVKALEHHMLSAPIFWKHDLGGVEAWLNDAAKALWLAYAGEEPVGCMGIGPANSEACAIIQDTATASIEMAFVKENARSRGAATTLLIHSLEWARSQGYARCAVDWETMNSPASRFWLRWFEPVCYSLMRHIDERLAGVHPA
jgi:GNAT superfamily N-acetyltransferase